MSEELHVQVTIPEIEESRQAMANFKERGLTFEKVIAIMLAKAGDGVTYQEAKARLEMVEMIIGMKLDRDAPTPRPQEPIQ